MEQNRGYALDGGVIVLNRDLTELDLFVKNFLDVFKKHSDYLIVSGFVSISTGRARGTEDVDIIAPRMNESGFAGIFGDLGKNGFWCYQGDDAESVYEYVKNRTNIRFARLDQIFPNVELIGFDEGDDAKTFEFSHPQKMRVGEFEFKVPPIEFEILYKELALGSQKDLADAKHLRTFFSELIDEERFEKYRRIIKK